MQYINDSRPWTDGRDRELSMVDLVMNETIPVGPAGMLWWALERGASVLTAGGPSGAGKSTLANACLGFLPDDARAYAVSGHDDPMLIPAESAPTYLLVNELSDHGRPYYIAGPPARRAFSRLQDGHRLIGTLHADSVKEAIGVLVVEVGLSLEDIARVELIAITRVEGELFKRGQPRPSRAQLADPSVRRRIVELGLLAPDPIVGVRMVGLTSWNAGSGRLEIAEPGITALAQWAGVATSVAREAIAERADVLGSLAAAGRSNPGEVADAVRQLRSR